MESGRRPEQNTRAAESEEPRYERRRSVSGPEHQYCAPGTPVHQYTRYTRCTNTPSTPSTPKTNNQKCTRTPVHQYQHQVEVYQVHQVHQYQYSAPGRNSSFSSISTVHQVHQNQPSNTPKPVPIHQCTKISTRHCASPGWSSVGDFYQGRTVFITGATGFMGKVDGSVSRSRST